MPHHAIRLKYLFYKLFILLRLPLAHSSLSLSFSRSFVRSSIFLYISRSSHERASSSLSLSSWLFSRGAHFFFLSSFNSSSSRYIYIPSLSPPRSFFSADSAAAESSHHSAAHKGGLRAPVSSTYDPNSAPYFFERLEKHAVTAVHVIACAQGASRLSVRRGRHVGHPWMTRWDEPRVQSMNKVSQLISCKLSSSMKSNVFQINFVKNDISNKGHHFREIKLKIKNYYDN